MNMNTENANKESIKPGDQIVCITKSWEIVRGHPTLTPKFNEIYNVRDTAPESKYLTLNEGAADEGYDKEGFEKLPGNFNKIISAIMKVPKPKKSDAY